MMAIRRLHRPVDRLRLFGEVAHTPCGGVRRPNERSPRGRPHSRSRAGWGGSGGAYEPRDRAAQDALPSSVHHPSRARARPRARARRLVGRAVLRGPGVLPAPRPRAGRDRRAPPRTGFGRGGRAPPATLPPARLWPSRLGHRTGARDGGSRGPVPREPRGSGGVERRRARRRGPAARLQNGSSRCGGVSLAWRPLPPRCRRLVRPSPVAPRCRRQPVRESMRSYNKLSGGCRPI